MNYGRLPGLACEARGRSAAKPRNDSFQQGERLEWRQNEDRFRLQRSRTGLLAAVSDGAGGSGLFCGPWAETLVARLPSLPIAGIDGLNRWMDGFCLAFRSDHLQKTLSQPVKHGKFVREGSFATLAACWLSFQRGKAAMRWLGYGDSQILVFDRTGAKPVLAAAYPPTLAVLERSPALLNWKDLPDKSRLRTGALLLPPRATIAVASDGMGQFLLFSYLAGHAPGLRDSRMAKEFARLSGNDSRLGEAIRAHRRHPRTPFAKVLEQARAALKSDAAFCAYVQARHRDGLLANDDATLLLIDHDETRPLQPLASSAACEPAYQTG